VGSLLALPPSLEAGAPSFYLAFDESLNSAFRSGAKPQRYLPRYSRTKGWITRTREESPSCLFETYPECSNGQLQRLERVAPSDRLDAFTVQASDGERTFPVGTESARHAQNDFDLIGTMAVFRESSRSHDGPKLAVRTYAFSHIITDRPWAQL
jgi:hypothetical protein